MEPVGNPTTEEPGNPTTAEPGNPTTGEPGNTSTADPENHTTGEPGNPTTAEPGNPTTGEPGNTSTADPENLLVLTPTWNQDTYRLLQENHPEPSSRFEKHILFTPSGNLILSNPSESKMRNVTTENSGNITWNRKPDRVNKRR